ncbi:MAG: hypothetical protein FJY91_03045 [Candidatus Harrisonbacteria bacterium]|nr:hypothetical protein [Candidatus Harrisonbacteria bacterium]
MLLYIMYWFPIFVAFTSSILLLVSCAIFSAEKKRLEGEVRKERDQRLKLEEIMSDPGSLEICQQIIALRRQLGLGKVFTLPDSDSSDHRPLCHDL